MPRLHELFTATVRDLSSEGAGIVAHPDGQVFFVPGVWPGETGQFRVSGFRKRHGFAELVALQSPHPQRVAAPCRHHGFGGQHCGGCPWQFMAYPAQLAAKEQRVRQVLAPLGLAACVEAMLGSPKILGYRNRTQLKSDGRRLGYMARGSTQLVDVTDCPILSEHNRASLAALRERLPESGWRPRRKGSSTTLDIDEALPVGEASINSRRPFRQANDEQNLYMRSWLTDRLGGLPKDWPVSELFAGSGNFTAVLSALGFDDILAAEGVGEALDSLTGLQLPGVRSLGCDLFAEAGMARVAQAQPDTRLLVLDPPRDGFAQLPRALERWPQLMAVAYISCDPATFRRDVAELLAAGFVATTVQPLDLFPHTPHVELLGMFQRPM